MTAPRERTAQRRRTRRAIVEATMALLQRGTAPSVNEIAEAAEVSRRTVYLHFPTLDQLIVDAVAGSMSSEVDDALAALTSTDPRVRLRTMVEAVAATMSATLPLGRTLIRVTVDPPVGTAPPQRGHRRIGWIDAAVEPVRAEIGDVAYERLVSALAVVVGWEAFVVLADVRGLDGPAAAEVVVDSALAILDAARARR